MHWLIGFIGFLLMVASGSVAQATTYWVSTTGSDANACSAIDGDSDPGTYKRTIGDALTDCAGPGHTIMVKNGTYAERIGTQIPTGTSESQRTILKAQNVGGAIVMQTTAGHGLEIFEKTYITIDGIVLDGSNGPASEYEGIKVSGLALTHHINILNVTVRNYKDGTGLQMHGNTHSHRVSNVRLEDNATILQTAGDVKNVGIYWSCHDSTLEDSYISNSVGASIQLYWGSGDGNVAVRGNTIRRNVFRNSTGSAGILLYGYSNAVYNNTIVGPLTSGIQINGNNNVVRNNIIERGNDQIVKINGTGNVVSDNFCESADADAGCDATGDPLFTSAGTGDYTLQSGSGARNIGTASVVTSSDVSAGRFHTATTITGFEGAAPDAGAFEFGSIPDEPLTVELLLNNNVTDSSTYAKTITNTSVTFSAADQPEGTHWGLWNAATDALGIPTNGMSAAQGVISMVFDTSSFNGGAAGARQYLFGHSSSATEFANRIQVYETNTGMLNVGMGDTHSLLMNAFQMSLSTRYHVALTWSGSAGSGQVCLYVQAIERGCASYNGLSQLGSTLTIGNEGVGNDEGWRGRVDVVRVKNVVMTPTEIDAECDTVISGGCSGGTLPVFVTPALQTGWVTATDGRTWTGLGHAVGPIDPAVVCAAMDGESLHFTGVYSTGRQPIVTNCSVGADGKTVTLITDVPPPSAVATITIQYDEDTPVSVTNNFSPPVFPNTGISQDSYMCRYPSDDDMAVLRGRSNTSCRDVNATSPGQIAVLMSVVNASGATLPNFETGLVCKLNAGSEFRVGVDFGGNPVRFLLTGSGLLDNTAFTDRQLLPTPAGKTFARRVVRRSDSEAPIDLENDKFIVNEWYLEINSGLVAGTDTLYCKTVLKDGTALASYGAADVAVAAIPIRRGRVHNQK